MLTRVGGTTLALVAAVSLALSIAGALGPLPGWWSGHPNVQGTLLRSKHVDIGLIDSRGCNTGGDKTCQPVDVTGTVKTTGFVAAGAAGLLALASVLLAVLAAVQSERRKSIAKLAVFAVVVAGIVAIALILQGPGIEARTPDGKLLAVSVPLGSGTYLFAGGMMSAIVASVLALRPTAAARPRMPRAVARQVGPGPAAPPQGQQFDVNALLGDDALRPAALGPEPRIGRSTPQPGIGALQGPASPPGPPGPQPLFSGAPQLRPLYEATPDMGGTGGFIPLQPSQRSMHPPAPMPREQIRALAGIPTPPPFDVVPELPRSGPLAFATTSPDIDQLERDPMELPSLPDTPAAF
ncbi:MAG TPA: hypothetical protein VK932_25925, partial [Kofleriaceae bacterium]|nr:hypothetical protein [Kofleriaceae bacterium]